MYYDNDVQLRIDAYDRARLTDGAHYETKDLIDRAKLLEAYFRGDDK